LSLTVRHRAAGAAWDSVYALEDAGNLENLEEEASMRKEMRQKHNWQGEGS